ETPVPFKQYIKDIKDVFKNHKRWLIAVFIIGAILMFILFGFLFYLSSVLEDKFSIDGIKKGLLLAIPLLDLSIASYMTVNKIKYVSSDTTPSLIDCILCDAEKK